MAPLAYAGTYSYANGVSTREYQVRYSGPRHAINGGNAATEPFSGDGAVPIVLIETYRPSPGYTTLGFATGGGSVTLQHTRATNAHQKCWWNWPWTNEDIGSLRMYCDTRY